MWKRINGFNNYFVSNNGRIYSTKTKKFLKSTIDKYGYLVIRLRDENKKTCNLFIHRLVGLNFIENPNNLPQINHIDKNKLNNNHWNLEWCTNKYNQIHKRMLMNTSSNYLYIHYSNSKNKWIVQKPMKNNKKRCYKSFKTEKEAKLFLDEASDPLVVNQNFN